MKKTLLGGIAAAALFAFGGMAQADVTMGVAGPLTGANAAFGAQLKNGVTKAVEDINKKGGINGEKIILIPGDDVSDPKQGVSVANKFVSDGVKYVVGHFNSGVSIPASEIYAENGILEISPASTNPVYTDRGLWNTFRTCGRDDQQGAVAGAFILKHFAGKKVAVLHDKTPYGKGLADETKKTINAGGMTEVIYDGVNAGEKDFSALVSKLKSENVDIVYFGGLHTEAGLIIRQMRDQGVKAPLFSGDGIVSSEFWSIAGPGAEGTLMTFSPDPRKNPAAKQVVEEFIKSGFDPEAYTLYSYAAVQVIAEAARVAGTTDSEVIAKTIRTGQPFETVIGTLKFDEKGDVTRPDYVVYVWKDGKYTELEN